MSPDSVYRRYIEYIPHLSTFSLGEFLEPASHTNAPGGEGEFPLPLECLRIGFVVALRLASTIPSVSSTPLAIHQAPGTESAGACPFPNSQCRVRPVPREGLQLQMHLETFRPSTAMTSYQARLFLLDFLIQYSN